MGRLLLVDGHSLAYRAFYALPAENFSTSTGQTTNAVYGFTSMLINVLRDEAPTHLAVAFDVSKQTFRLAEYPEYKAGRSVTPPEFPGQIPLIREVLGAMGVSIVTAEGYEADDVICTLTKQARAAGHDVLVVTGDRDAFQLVDDHVTVLYPVRGVSELTRMTPAAVEAKYGIPPERYPDLAALVGETSDNLPGVPGVGPKTAAKWITQYDGLVGVVAAADAIKGKAGENLRAHLSDVERNRRLNRLVDDLPLGVEVDTLERGAWDRDAIHTVFDGLEFRVLRDRLFETLDDDEPEVTGGFTIDVARPSGQEVADWTAAVPAGARVGAEVVLAADLVGPGNPTAPSALDGVAVAAPDGSVAVLDVADLLRWVASPTGPELVLHDAKPQLHALARAAWARGLAQVAEDAADDDPATTGQGSPDGPGDDGAEHVSDDGTTGARGLASAIAGLPAGDTSLAAYLCRPDQRSYDLADLSVRHLGRTLVTAEPATEDVPVEEQLSLGLDESEAAAAEESPEDLVLAARARRDMRAGIRASAVAELDAVLLAELEEREGTALLADLELPLERVLVRMESTGIAVDVEHLEGLREHYDVRVSEAARLAYAEIDEQINLGSPKQLQRVLFEDLGMPKTKRTKTGYTTDAEALQDLYASTEHPFLLHLLEHRDAIRLRQTVEGLLASVAEDRRIRTTFQQTIAATGRLSSTDPNLQNIPIRTEEGRRIRSGFVVGSDADGPLECLMSADYSQIEMRIMAHLSGDEGLIEAFTAGEDLHRFVGSRVFQVEPEQVSNEMRSKVKAMSYGLAYGLSAFGLSRQLRVPVDEARGLMDEYFERFGGVRDYLHSVVDQARKDGWTATLLGRRRYLPDLTSDNRQRREMAERMALNAPIQGSAADLIKVAMLRVQDRLDSAGLRSRMLLQVHDELVLEVAPGELEQVKELVVAEMAGAAQLSVPLEVSVGVGRSWFDAAH
ncbi:DNA polymerase I [Aquipuribacter sp. MA13-6]|uniref:DNA polymerase I n=1 Tax=unclassified Aquipuribacter TaxID=2635084 RepID=UPI003EE879F1